MIGTRLAHFHITGHLGSGGMGDVYEATDSKLGRSVAIKLLPEAFARDSERVARFEREARVLASLNAPNIAAIYGLERLDGRMFLVMEYVPGETLAERIHKGRIPAEEALGIARQIVEALEVAHAEGVVHRDLKPANVKITPQGRVKVLDFGLAKAYSPEAARNADPSNSPTLMSAASAPGVILGTAAYMSPEQAKGREVDKRSDIFAFGCVLYEMLTGKRTFDGEDVSDILSSVLKVDPDWSHLPSELSGDVRKLLRLCLEKNKKNRLNDAADVRLLLEEALKEPAAAIAVSPSIQSSKTGWIAAGVMMLAFASLAAIDYSRKPPPAGAEMRVEITTPPSLDPAFFAISPDGQSIASVAIVNGQLLLMVRPLNAVSDRVLPGTEGATYPFWSPDSRSIGFFADSKLKRIDVAGAAPRTLADAPVGGGGSWNQDGVILFAPSVNAGISRITAGGGDAVAVTHPPVEWTHRFPQFLPDGRHFLFFSGSEHGVYVGALEGEETRRLLEADTTAVFVAPHDLLFGRQGTLYAQTFDPVRLALSGDPAVLAEQIPTDVTLIFGAPAFSASAAGMIAYRSGPAGGLLNRLAWFDRAGKEIGQLGDANTGLANPQLSPDGRRVAVDQIINRNVDVWLIDTSRGISSRFTFDPALDRTTVWSRDGRSIAFSSNRKGKYDIYQKAADGAANEEPLVEAPDPKFPMDFSPDGRFLLFRRQDAKTGWDLWVLPLTGEKKPFPVAQTNFDEREGQFSPDGKWLAYQSNESGRFEIYVQPFPGPGGKFQVSTNGGTQVRWRHDGKEIFYIGPDGKLMAAPIQLDSSRQTVEAGKPILLFQTHIWAGLQRGLTTAQQYAVSLDGQRFLVNNVAENAATSPITLILNWRRK